MLHVLKECIDDENINTIMIATGYWDMPGLALLTDNIKGFLQRQNTKLLLLIGQDPYIYASQLKEPKYQNFKYPTDFIRTDINDLEVKKEYEEAISLLLDYCTDSNDAKFQIRIYRKDENQDTQFLHSKCYIFDGLEQGKGYGIIGSSNFTAKGLQGNAELNYMETGAQTVLSVTPIPNHKSHKQWFEEKWNISQPWNKEFLEQILLQAPITNIVKRKREVNKASLALSPFEVYIKYLQQYFGDLADGTMEDMLNAYLPKHYTRLSFQLDAVKQGFSIMKRYGGFILADVVGLGKTITALLLIRLFLDQATKTGRASRILIVTPPAIKQGWIKTIEDFDKDKSFKLASCIDFITTGSIGKLACEEVDDEDGDDFETKLEFKEYGMIVIDESHNFRNNSTQKYQDLDDLIGNIMPTPFVCLLSATPQNNAPRDLYNQIRLFQRNTNNCSLPNVPNGRLASFFDSMNTKFTEARNLPADSEENKKKAADIIAEVSREIRRCVLNDIVVRRTRTDIKRYYPADSSTLNFPTIQGPKALEYRMDAKLAKLFAETVEAICPVDSANGKGSSADNTIQFHRYTAIAQFIDQKNAKLYERRNLTVTSISKRLQTMMRNMLVKRLESSISAFKVSLRNLLDDTDLMVEMLDNDTVFICPDIDLSKVYAECGKNFVTFKAKVNRLITKKPNNNRCFSAADFQSSYRQDLTKDRYLIKYFVEQWDRNNFDPKLQKFIISIPRLFDPKINCPKSCKPKLVIFTEAIATQEEIVRALENAEHKVLQISAKNRDKMSRIISANFDANYPEEEQKNDFDVIVTTEVLAEGVNLHRANVILNYDTPWNSTRLMQRIGRVNRIGSTEDFVHVFNFFPSAEGNHEIKLIEKAFAKLQSFHELFGEDSKVFSDREQVRSHELTTMTDGEESPFSRFIITLKEFAQQHPKRYKEIIDCDFTNLGGVLNDNPQRALTVYIDESGAMVSVLIDNISSPQAHIIAPLDTMEYLEYEQTKTYLSVEIEAIDLLRGNMLNAYISHAAHMMISGTRGKKRKEALTILKQWRQKTELTRETLDILSQIDSLVRENNGTVISHVIKCNENISTNPSLFGDDFDINAWMTSAFSRLAEQAVQRRGVAIVAIEALK